MVIIAMLNLCYIIMSYAIVIFYYHTLVPNISLILYSNKRDITEVRGIQQTEWGHAPYARDYGMLRKRRFVLNFGHTCLCG